MAAVIFLRVSSYRGPRYCRPATQNDRVGIEDINDQSDGLGESIGQPVDGGLRMEVMMGMGTLDDLLQFAGVPDCSA